MNPPQLASRLHAIAHQIENHASRMQGGDIAKAIGTLQKQLDSFEKKLQATVEGNAPGIKELGVLLKAKDNTRHLNLVGLRVLAKDIFGTEAPKAAKPGDLKTAILKAAARRGQGEVAVRTVRAFLDRAKAPKTPVPKDEQELKREFLRLGGLSEEAFEYEIGARWSSVASLKALAKANAIAVPKGVKKPDLLREIKSVCRRAHANVAA